MKSLSIIKSLFCACNGRVRGNFNASDHSEETDILQRRNSKLEQQIQINKITITGGCNKKSDIQGRRRADFSFPLEIVAAYLARIENDVFAQYPSRCFELQIEIRIARVKSNNYEQND